MKEIIEEIKSMDKEKLYDRYFRIVNGPKDYDNISKKKMIEDVFKYYEDYENIITICSFRELKFLEKILKGEDYLLEDVNYDFELYTLIDKFILNFDGNDEAIIIPELEKNIKLAIKNVKWNEVKNHTSIAEIAVSCAKCSGTGLMNPLSNIVAAILQCDRKCVEELENFLINYPLFRYYVSTYEEENEVLGNVYSYIYNDYFDFSEEIDDARAITPQVNRLNIDKERYVTLFYNDFDIRNPKIQEYCDEIYVYPLIDILTRPIIKEVAALNLDREIVYNYFKDINDDVDFVKLLNIVMDDYPSPIFNGLSLNEYKEFEKDNLKIEDLKNNIPDQKNAHLNKKDCDLFYKIYFALLQFTNDKYNIKPKMKIYKQIGIIPEKLLLIVDKFWENKDELVNEFIEANIYKFKKEELDIVKEFKKGVKGTYFIVKLEEEFTAFINLEKTFMVKGLNCNIDKIIDKKKLPIAVETVILPFKKVLVFDGMLREYQIEINLDYNKFLEDYNTDIKYYHM